MKKIILTILAASFGLGGLTYLILYYYISHSDIQFSLHGYIAMGLGVFFAYGLGCGLMALLFFSNRHGHDETVYTFRDTLPEDTFDELDDSDKK